MYFLEMNKEILTQLGTDLQPFKTKLQHRQQINVENYHSKK